MEREFEYLLRHRIIWRRLPINDTPTETFDWGWYYEEGTFECYTLFTSKAKINTYKSLKWHLLVLWYLNPQLDSDDFQGLAEILSNREFGFTTFTPSKENLERMIYSVSMYDLETPPKNRLRKVIFKPFLKMEVSEKLKIVGELIGRSKKVHPDDIYQCMIDLHEWGKPITIDRIAGLLDCSVRTIHRNMGEELKREKELLNHDLNTNV